MTANAGRPGNNPSGFIYVAHSRTTHPERIHTRTFIAANLMDWTMATVQIHGAAPLVVTEAAVNRIRFLQDKEGKPGAALRLRIVAGGCSGMQYRIDLAEELRPTDLVAERNGVQIAVDPKSVTYLKESTLDWEEDFFGGEFKVKNPNAKTSCSCGISFTV